MQQSRTEVAHTFETTALAKRAGWREHGILVVAGSDRRLTWPEQELVRQLGAKLYGRRSEGDR